MGELLRLQGFRRLLIGQTISSLGDWMGTLALMYFVLELSGSTTAVGGILVLRLLLPALSAPLTARAVTRWNRRQVMMTTDLLRAGMVMALPLIPWIGWVYFWAFAMEMVSLAFLSARDASIPVLVNGKDRTEGDTGRLALANGVTMAAYYAMTPLGAGVLGLVLVISDSVGWTGHWPYVVVFWLDALTFLASYLAIRSLPDLGPHEAAEPDHEKQREGGSIKAALRIPLVRLVLPATGMIALGLGALFSLGVVFVRDVLGAGPAGFGALVALFGAGAALGMSVLRRRSDQGQDPVALIRMGATAQGLVVTTMALIASAAWAYLGAVLFGAATTIALVSAITYIQDSLDGVQRNLALTAFHTVLKSGLALAALLAGAAADLVGEVHLGVLGSLDPAQTVLAASGLIVLGGGLLIRPAEAAPADVPEDTRQARHLPSDHPRGCEGG